MKGPVIVTLAALGLAGVDLLYRWLLREPARRWAGVILVRR